AGERPTCQRTTRSARPMPVTDREGTSPVMTLRERTGNTAIVSSMSVALKRFSSARSGLTGRRWLGPAIFWIGTALLGFRLLVSWDQFAVADLWSFGPHLFAACTLPYDVVGLGR